MIEDRPFALDPFQQQAIEALERGHSVVVAAPTGAGKTVIAEHAVALARREGEKAFYTTPIKALSNQKYHDLVRTYGRGEVGLLTGDNAIAADAATVVMTTEVLRNMLYARSPTLDRLRWVVLDEVHFLEDPYRGPVWEEVVIHLPRSVGLVCLSATVSNAEELAEWVRAVRGETELVVETRRPVPLRHEYVVGERGRPRPHVVPLLVKGQPNSDGARFDAGARGQGQDGHRQGGRQGGRPSRRWFTTRRADVVGLLASRELLPSIYFLFSRAGCDDAARALVATGIELARPGDQARIDEIIDEHVAGLSPDDLIALGYEQWRAGLLQGIAAHHAGMVPPFKEAVEASFVEGLVQVVFATETLALGINMPARSVVIERLTKFTGETHALLTPGQYTQLTGRAGRRGIDEVGHALVLWSPWVPFQQVATLAQSRAFELRSAFRPTYNMAANLVRQHDREEAHRLLLASFGQFQASRAVTSAASEALRLRDEAASLESALQAELGPGERWEDLLDDEAEEAASRADIEAAVRQLRPGDVVRFAPDGVGVLLKVSQRGPFSRVAYVDSNTRRHTLHSTALAVPPERLGAVELPLPYAPDDPGFATDAARGLADFLQTQPELLTTRRERRVRRILLRRARELQAVFRDADALERQAAQGSGSLIVRFDQVLAVLSSWRFVDGWSLTDRGALLSGLFHECDLLIAEAIARGVLDGLDAPDLAAVLSGVVYEHRGAEPPPEPHYPTPVLRDRSEALHALGVELNQLEAAHEVALTRLPDPTFVPLAQAWAAGGDLDDVLADEVLTGGDFVRIVKQLVDVLGQVGKVAPEPATRRNARRAASELRRGIVAASSLVEGVDEADGPDGVVAAVDDEGRAPAPAP